MIQQIGQVMLYVKNPEEVMKFWTEKAGFVLIAEHSNEMMHSYEVAPTVDAETSFVLHDKAIIAKMSPELTLGTPSIMFYTANIESLYADYQQKGITVGELVEMPFGKVFNFADDEGNYFAVTEKK
ncbi:VOC family protein [Solibacillus sp. CAU 1738]|uniref:VOC family protein n=1 Tax=Solibacillus sp. CAU 1738 TaxID=3140363 RepID=UPI003260833F